MKRIICVLIVAVLMLGLAGCGGEDIMEPLDTNIFYGVYNMNKASAELQIQATYEQLFGISAEEINAEKERVESRGDTFRMLCEIQFEAAGFEGADTTYYKDISQNITAEDYTKKVQLLQGDDKELISYALTMLPATRENAEEAVAYTVANARLWYGNEIAFAMILFYCDDVIAGDYRNVADGSEHIVSVIPY